MNNINILLFSNEDWTKKYTIPNYIHIVPFNGRSLSDRQYKDLVIIDRDINKLEREYLQAVTRAHCLFITENAEMTEHTAFINDSKVGKRLYTGDLSEFWIEAAKYYPEPYGEKLSPDYLQVNQNFKGSIDYSGRFDLVLAGNFGDDFSQIVYWKHNIPIFKDQCIDLYLEHEKSGSVEIKLRVIHFYSGGIEEIQQIWEFDDDQLSDVVRIDNKMNEGPMFFSILAKGEGTLRIVSLHDRYSRMGAGFFLPGGQRYVTPKGEEIFAYFDPGDLKPPLAFYFSGYRRQEGFEGYMMMKKLGCPFVLITDPRLEGGSFYLGDEDYENMMVGIIKKYMSTFKATPDQVFFCGASMGTFGAMYYACDIKPHALVLGKPLASLGTMAANETLMRVGGFPTSLELMIKEYGSLDEDALQAMNERFWKKFEKTDWSKTKFIVSYLYEDDYDMEAYRNLLMHLNSEGVQVFGKGLHGRHNDNTTAVFEWFKKQMLNVVYDDFRK